MLPDFIATPAPRQTQSDRCLLIASYDIEAYSDADFAQAGLEFPDFLSGAVPKRRAEFLAGRVLALVGLERLGSTARDIGRGARGEPLWPEGYFGSISHSHGTVGVWLGRDGASLGLDIEALADDGAVKAIRHSVLTERERAALGTDGEAATAAFSAKEALYKALYPRVQAFFGFDHAEVYAITGAGLTLRLTKPLPGGYRPGQTFDIAQQWEAGKVTSLCEDPQ